MPASRESSAQRRRAASSAQTRRRIIRATRDLVPKSGSSLPVSAIARAAGVAVQTIYDHFGSKGGLLMATVNDVQESSGLYAAFQEVFHSPDGETAMRRMLVATIGLWHGAWPFVEFTIRARRSDPVVTAAMENLDRLRFAHFEAIVQRIGDEGRLRAGATIGAATAEAFALSTATVYEELAVRRPGSLDTAVDAVTRAVLGGILEPGAVARDVAPPDWPALEAAAASRALAGGAATDHLTPTWFGSGAWAPGEPPPVGVRGAGAPPRGSARPPE
jgi:AcrR family transcriptional regulator